jgi:hypothetical protein
MSPEAIRAAALGAVQTIGAEAVGLTQVTLGTVGGIILCILGGTPAEHRAVLAVAEGLDPLLGTAAWRPANDAERQAMDDDMSAWAQIPQSPLH